MYTQRQLLHPNLQFFQLIFKLLIKLLILTKKSSLYLLFFVVIIHSISFSLDFNKENGKNQLTIILKKCAEYCEKLDNVSLHFVCNEKVKERIFYAHGFRTIIRRSSPFYKDNTYLYDYQLIRKNKIIHEQRILLKKNGKEVHEKNASLKTKLFMHKYVIFGPIGLLSAKWQQHHDYKFIKNAKINGEKAIVLKATPKSNNILNHLYGKIWIKKDDSSILKIEWNQASIGNYDKIQEKSKKINAIPRITCISEYGFEKNSIRFPSKYTVKEEYVYKLPQTGTFKNSEIFVKYIDYNFFTVETEVKYRDK